MFLKTLLVFFASASVWGAAPLFHAYVADKWVEILEDYTDKEKQAFIQGTLFPDIRYPAKLARTATHEHGLTLEQIKDTPDPFLKGLRLHTFVDDVREKMLVQPEIIRELEEQIPVEAYHLLKLIEDEILYSMIPNEKPLYYAESLNTIDPGALQFQAPLETIQQWHEAHAHYFRGSPSSFLLELHRSGRSFFGLSGSELEDFYQAMIESKSQDLMRKHVKCAIDLFEDIFIKFNKEER